MSPVFNPVTETEKSINYNDYIYKFSRRTHSVGFTVNRVTSCLTKCWLGPEVCLFATEKRTIKIISPFGLMIKT